MQSLYKKTKPLFSLAQRIGALPAPDDALPRRGESAEHGRIQRRDTVLYVANHISYLDIVAMGSLVEACFVARHDIAV